MPINTDNLKRCISTLDQSLAKLNEAPPDSVDFEIYRNAVVKGFELTLETTGKLLRKVLKAYGGSPKSVDELFYKDVLRHAGKHGLLTAKEIERWFVYRNNRNSTAHDYGEGFANETLQLMPGFLKDARNLETTLATRFQVLATDDKQT
jgi:nucleotidyltransferase substrate binding protein (TIGR01987 family)